MNNIITFRTNKIEELKKLAKKNGTSLSNQPSDIVNEYLHYHLLTSKLDMYRDSKRMLSASFDFLTEVALYKLAKITIEDAVQSIKTMTTDLSIPNICKQVKNWFKFNNFVLDEFVQEEHVKVLCKNPMGKNWNIYAANTLVGIFANFGYAGTIVSTEKGFFSVKILKKKSEY